jgi:hypothetical protein
MTGKSIQKILFLTVILLPFLLQQSCKKQPKCGCGKDMIFELKSKEVMVVYNEATNDARFYPVVNNNSTYYFCNPGNWIDTLKTMNTSQYLLLSGKVYYECNYLYQNSNYYYQLPPVYQVDVTDIQEDNYGK